MPQAASKTKNTETRKTAWRGISVKQKSPSRPNSTGTSRKSFGSISSSDSQQLFDDKSSGRDTIDSLPPKLESVKEYSTPLPTSHSNKTTRSRASSTTSESLFQDANDGFMQQQNNMNPSMAGVQNNSYQEEEEDEDDAFYYSSYFLADTQKTSKLKKVSTASPSLLPQQGKHRITSLTYGGPSLLPESQMDKEPIIKSTSLENLQKQSTATAVALDNNINKPTSPYKKERNNITEIYDNAITPGIADTVATVNTSSSSLIVDDPVDLTTMTTKATTETPSASSTPTPKRHSSLPSKKEIIPIIPPNDSEDSPFIGNTSTSSTSSTSKKHSKKSDKKYRSRSNSIDIHRYQENDSSPPPPLPTAPIPPISNTSSLTDPLSKTRVHEKYIDQAPKDPLPPIPRSPFSVVTTTTNTNTNTTPNNNNMTSKEEQVQTLDLQKDSTNNNEDSEDEHYNHPIINKDSIPTTEIIPDQQRQHQKPAIVSTTSIVSNHDPSFVVVEEDINQRRDSLSTASVSTVDSDDRIKFSEDRQSHSRYDFLPMAVEEDPTDLDMLKDNEITIQSVDVRNIHSNRLSPRDQEEADEHVREGMRLVFNNKFMRAKAVFQPHASADPLYGVGLGVIATIKAMMTQDEKDMDKAISTLASAYTIAKAQIDSASIKRSLKDSLSQYFSTFMVNNNNELASPAPVITTSTTTSSGATNGPIFLSNGVLRAHVIKAECSLFMAILQLSRENVVDYLKCGLNLRRAHKSYTIVWQEYKRMGQEHTKRMDRDTVSGVQFGIGAINLLISALPPKILKIFSSFGFTSDKELGLVLLKLCLEGKGIRSPLAAIMLLSYYSILSSLVPQLYSKELSGPAVECLLEAQKSYPSSCFFLYFAAKIARIAGNLPLSLQSFSFAMDASRSEMMEVAMRNVTLYETGWNHALQLDWESAAKCFEDLAKDKYSPAFCMYVVGACREMLGQRTQGILAFAEVPQHMKKEQKHQQQEHHQQSYSSSSYIESYVHKKIEHFQKSGYQDMDFNLPMFELLCIWNIFEQMDHGALEHCLETVNSALNRIHERERRELSIRTQELAPSKSPPDYYHYRALILLIKASVLNALQRYGDSIPHLNWIMDNKDDLTSDAAAWIIPFAYWEAGVTSWGLHNYVKSRKLWQQGLACSKYDFEYRMAIRFNLALAKCNDIGIAPTEKSTTEKILGMHAQKRAMSVQHPTTS